MNKGLIISEDSSLSGFVSATLAGNYAIQICQDTKAGDGSYTWSLFDIQDVINAIDKQEKDHTTTTVWTDGTRAVEALKIISNPQKEVLSTLKEPKAILMCFRDEEDHIELQINKNTDDNNDILDDEFLLLLQLLQSQWIARNQQQQQHTTTACRRQ